jgi:hypothetical protein
MTAREQKLIEVLRPFANIELIRDDDPQGVDAISGPDLAITPNHVRCARDLLAALSPDPMETPPPSSADETAWLIEMTVNGVPNCWGPIDGTLDFTPDHNTAIRFSRKQDAQAVIDDYGWTEVRAVEHMWCVPRAAPSPPKPEADDTKLIEWLRWMGGTSHKKAADRILALQAELASVRERTIEEIRRRLDNRFGMYLQLGIRDELALAKPAEKEKGECKHEGWDFAKYGRCCPKCSAFVADFGD